MTDETLEVLADVLSQACWTESGKLDSGYISAYAYGLRYLADHHPDFRRVDDAPGTRWVVVEYAPQ